MSISVFNNLPALVNAVFTETNRPDLLAETFQAVFSSTLKMHQLEFFNKDVLTARLVFDSAAYIQVLDQGSIPYFRRLAYIRKDNPTLYGPYEQNPSILPPLSQSIDGSLIPDSIARAELEEIDFSDILDEFGAERSDVCYEVGDSIMIRSSTLLQYALMGWFANPNLDIGNASIGSFLTTPSACSPLFNSWIARDYPYTIIYDAASAVLQKIGQTDAARKYDQQPDPRTGKGAGLVWSHIDNLIRNNILLKAK